MMTREPIVSAVFDLLTTQTTVKLGKVSRDPLVPTELARTSFPAVYLETADQSVEDISFDGLRQAFMNINIVLYVYGSDLDVQRNIAIEAIEQNIMADRKLGGLCKDIALTEIETVEVGEASPYASCRVIFTCEYCYNLEEI